MLNVCWSQMIRTILTNVQSVEFTYFMPNLYCNHHGSRIPSITSHVCLAPFKPLAPLILNKGYNECDESTKHVQQVFSSFLIQVSCWEILGI